MKTYVALFRGINVGGNNILPMKELVTIMEFIGARDVKTYIQSGNAVFKHAGGAIERFSKDLSAEINRCRGFDPFVVLLELDVIDRVLNGNPFPEAEAEPSKLHCGFLAAIPEKPDLEKLTRLKKANERFALVGTTFYLHTPEGIGTSKLVAASEKLLGVPMTYRNWRTVCKIRELADN